MLNLPPSKDLDRFRSWALTALYGSMAILSLLLTYALFALRTSFENRSLEFYGAIIVALVTAFFSVQAGLGLYKTVKSGGPQPRLALKTFFFMALTLLVAGRLLNTL